MSVELQSTELLSEPGGEAVSRFIQDGPKRMLIGGEWSESESREIFETINPATGAPITEVAKGSASDVDRAVAAARDAFEGPWSEWKPSQRQDLLIRFGDLLAEHFDELGLLDTLDIGAPWARTPAMKERRISMMRYYASLAVQIHGETIENSIPGNVFSYTLKEPVGVVGGIIPWNGPLNGALTKLGPVLASGCTMVLKPAEQSPLSALRLGELLQEAGLPDGVVNIVPGFGEVAGAALTAHPGVDKVAFTGSRETGQRIVEASSGNLKRLMLELGGKSPNIVMADADLDKAVPGSAMAVFFNSGQVCTAGTRLFVQEPIYEEFVQRISAFAEGLAVGDPLAEGTQMGPLVSAEQLDRVVSYLSTGINEGASLTTGGMRLTEDCLGNGYFVAPTVFSNVADDMTIAREEIFGPVISAIEFETVDEAIRRANDSVYGLGAGVWTRDVSTAHRMARSIKSGTVWVNSYHLLDPSIPLGGYKMSGYGREGGAVGLDEYLTVKSVVVNT